MTRFGLRYQLTGWFLLIGVVPAVAVSAYLYSVTRTGLFREAAALMRADADATADRFSESFDLVRDQLVLAAQQVAQRVAEARPAPRPRPRSKPPRVNFDPAVNLLMSWGNRAPVPFETWAVVDASAEPRLAFVDGQPGAFGALSDADRALAIAAQAAPEGDIVFGGMATSAQTARRVVTFAAPIPGVDGTAIGSLHGEIPVEWFQRALEVRVTPGGSLWVFDHAGQLVLTTDARPDADHVAVPLVTEGRDDGDRSARLQIGSEAAIAVSLPLTVTGAREPWTVTVSAPEHAIARKANPWRYVAVTAGLAVAVALLAALISARITRPINTLESGARRIAQGDLDFDLQLRGHNELEQLAGSFHQMAYTLKRAQERLTKAERMAAIGEVSLAVHHELHALSVSVIGHAERLKAEPDLPPPVREQVAPISEGVGRMREIIQKLDHINDQTAAPVPDRQPGGTA
jgi:HAMP domain-containing protein